MVYVFNVRGLCYVVCYAVCVYGVLNVLCVYGECVVCVCGVIGVFVCFVCVSVYVFVKFPLPIFSLWNKNFFFLLVHINDPNHGSHGFSFHTCL